MGQPDMQTSHINPTIAIALIQTLCDISIKMRWHAIMKILVLWDFTPSHWENYAAIEQYSITSQKT
jgi:hypothetical protein